MAMTILNNSATLMTLGQLNKNITKVGKSLAKVAKGQKINSASDDASAYGISEQMRVQIRGLEQDIQNVQNGSAMLKTAHGGVENIVEELRSLKELAINAANDSNTDADRQIIQKEFDKRRDTIDDIATWTNYNTKPLIDGTYSRIESNIDGQDGSINKSKLDVVFVVDTTGSMSSYITEVASNLDTFAERLDEKNISWRFGLVQYGDVLIGENTLKTKFESGGEFTSDAEEFVSVMEEPHMYGGGDGPESGYDGIMDLENGAMSYKYRDDAIKCVIVLTDANTHSPNTTGKGRYNADEVIGAAKDKNLIISSITRPNIADWKILAEATNGKIYDISSDYGNSLEDFVEYIPSVPEQHINKGKPLTIHHGPHANQATNFYINDMHCAALGIDKAEVLTRPKATSAIGIIDRAIEYALNEATYLGSYLQRLDYTESNVTTQNENAQYAESTIRDADMAKEMTEYTKWNVLSQASQSMLAQANQNLSGVLSLLQ